MALPKYDKTKRKKTFEQLPKGAYVVKIMDAKEEQNRNNNGSHLTVSFDIAEGDYEGFYANQYMANTSEDKKWSRDAVFYLTVPSDGCNEYIWTNWNTFFADLEDSNNGFVFSGNPRELKNKLIGGKFAIEQNEYNGQVYSHTRMRWTCVAEDVRSGKAGKMPNDKLITQPAAASDSGTDWMSVPEGIDEDLPFA